MIVLQAQEDDPIQIPEIDLKLPQQTSTVFTQEKKQELVSRFQYLYYRQALSEKLY